ncbi:MAG: fused MFS/spermidine synthase [Giesbergeria sp.]|uniref:fused MFS/spermidine synthase n=1 Tax=Giesbergeria sp. TaxID=2818473 RepID=UPI00262FDA00|nr:fused MFS/spermidine synthase [Giesbergeria sp.]MDD2608421.1 fused MFS/spermidine synthase [Giesbergeria sp.]
MLPLRQLLIYKAAGWSGFFVMGVELLGGRLLAPFFGNSIFVWGGVIAVFMACLSVGYLLGGRLSLQQPSLTQLGLLLLGEALLALPIILLGDTVLEGLSEVVPDPRYGSLLGSLLLFGAPTVFSGMISPYAVRLLIVALDSSGLAAGRLYFVSTLGSAAGTLITSFYLVLYLEIHTILLCLMAISASIGLALMVLDRLPAHKLQRLQRPAR